MSWIDKLRPRAQPDQRHVQSADAAVDGSELPDMEPSDEEQSLAETARLARDRDATPGLVGAPTELPSDGMPSLNRGQGAGSKRLINVIGVVVILVVGAALIISVNKSPQGPKAAKPADGIANAMPTLVVPPPPGAATFPMSGASGAASGGPKALASATSASAVGGAKPIPLAGSRASAGPVGADGKPILEWWDRKRLGQAATQAGGGAATAAPIDSHAVALERAQAAAPGTAIGAAPVGAAQSREGGRDSLAARLEPTELRSATATVLADRNFLITKGTALDCALETAIDTTLPGILTCRLSRDVYSDNGQVLLLDRGTQLVGEQAGSVKQGQARVFALWNRAKTPAGVVISLNSPGTDTLGRSGLDGWVDNHFIERFGAAILMSIIQGAVNRYGSTSQEGGTTVYSGTAAGGGQIVEKILESTVNIPPTILKNQGDHIQVMVARDLDFSGVYALRMTP